MLKDDLAIMLKSFRNSARQETDDAFAGKAGQELLEYLSKRLSTFSRKPGVRAGILEAKLTQD